MARYTWSSGEALTAAGANTRLVQAAPASSRTLHIGSASVVLDANGSGTVTHGAGFTPTVVFATPNTNGGFTQNGVYGVDSFTSTTFRIRLAGAASITIPIVYLCLA